MKHAAALLRSQFPDARFSSVYSTAPLLHEEQEAFLNAAATFETDIGARDVYRILQVIEEELGKNPPFRFGPRTIDLDLLLYDDDTIDEEGLQVPHPRMMDRRFVLEPLAELDEKWKEQLMNVADQQCDRTDITL